MPEIRTATSDDLEHMAAVLADAFVDDPIMSWLFPDVASRPRLLEGMFGFAARHMYLPHGGCTVADDAATLWMPFGAESDDAVLEQHGEEFAVAVEGQLERLGMLMEVMGASHPTEPHHYLLAIGVRVSAQGRGLGGDLLTHTLGPADAAGQPAYLEASSVRSRALYERHGFEVIDELHIDDSPPMWPMWREPR